MALPVAARVFLACAVALAAASPAFAREDDVEFAMALADRGYEDLAEKEAARMLQGAQTSEAKENASYTRCQLLRRTALVAAAQGDQADPKEVRTRFSAAIEAFGAFLKTYPQSRLAPQAEFSVGDLMKDFAYFLSKNREKFPASEREGVAKEAAKTFDDAIAYLRKIKDREEEKDKDLPVEDPEKYWDRNVAWYYLCLAMFDRATIQPPGDALRNQHLTAAIDETTLLLEQTEGTEIGYFAGKLLGNCYWNRAQGAGGAFEGEDLKQALEWFDVPLGAADIPDLDQYPAARNAMLQAAFEFGEMCNAVGATPEINFPKLLIERLDAMEKKQPGMRKERFGLQALVEKAKAMAKMGSPEAAVTALNGISEETKDSPSLGGVDQLAKRALNEVLASIPSGSALKIGPDVLFKAAEGSLRDGELGRAIRAYQRSLLACEGEADPARRTALLGEYETNCWRRLNECYYRLDRYLEAYYAADVPVAKYLAARRTDEDEDIGELAVMRVRCMGKLIERTPKERQPRYDALKKAAESLIAEKFSWAGEDTVYAVGRQKLGAGNRLLASGDRGGAEAAHAEAIATFRKIGEKDPKYRMAQVSIGECLVAMGKHAEGLQHLSNYLSSRKDDAAKDAPVPDRQAFGWATYWTGEAHNDLKAHDKVIEVLADFEDRFQGASLDAFFPRVRFLRVQNFAAAGRTAEAEAQAEVLRKDSPDHARTPDAALVVANALVQAAAKKAASDPKGAEAMKRRGLDWYDFWLKRTSPTADHLTRIGEFHSEVGNIEKAAEYWTKALEMYQKKGDAKDAETLTVYLSGLLVDSGRYAEALPKFETLFVKTPEDITPLRSVFEELRRRPSNVAAPVHDENLKKVMADVEKAIAKDSDPGIAAQAADVKKASANGLDVELLVRAFVDKPEQRRALASAAVESILGFNAAMPPDLRAAVFNLVNRRPDLMSKLARCYQELAGADARNPIRAVNLYSALIESAQDDFTEPRKPGSKYSERWFDWKLNWAKVYLATGKQHKAEVWLRVVCDIVKGMETLKETDLADKARAGFAKEFQDLRDEADQELRKLGKDGCK